MWTLQITPKQKLNFFVILSLMVLIFYWIGDSVTFAIYMSKFGINIQIPYINFLLDNFISMLLALILLKLVVTVLILIVCISLSSVELIEKLFKNKIPIPKQAKRSEASTFTKGEWLVSTIVRAVKDFTLEKTSFSILFGFALFGIVLTIYNILLIIEFNIGFSNAQMLNQFSNFEYIIIIGVLLDFIEMFRGSPAE